MSGEAALSIRADGRDGQERTSFGVAGTMPAKRATDGEGAAATARPKWPGMDARPEAASRPKAGQRPPLFSGPVPNGTMPFAAFLEKGWRFLPPRQSRLFSRGCRSVGGLLAAHACPERKLVSDSEHAILIRALARVRPE